MIPRWYRDDTIFPLASRVISVVELTKGGGVMKAQPLSAARVAIIIKNCTVFMRNPPLGMCLC